MGRTVGINPKYLEKLDDSQRKFILTRTGLSFYDEFLTAHGKHLYIFGTTGSGKTNKGYAFVDWLKHLESQIWISSGKMGETLPLLCQGKQVEIIAPSGCDITIEQMHGKRYGLIPDHPKVIHVETAPDMLHAINQTWTESRHKSLGVITILEIRNAFKSRSLAVQWVADFFEELATACREGTCRKILPCTIHVDESQWTMAGARVANDPDRNRASEAIAENSFELRSAGARLVLYAQDWKNILITARENMLFNLLCRGADVKPEENKKLAHWTYYHAGRVPPSPQYYRTEHGRFVFELTHRGWEDSSPMISPWSFRRYPLDENDRKWIGSLRVRYVGKHDERTETEEVQYPVAFPQLGDLSAVTMPEERPTHTDCNSRYTIPDGVGG